MFVYGLIGAELLLLYVVFWYLFVRDPKHKSHIRPNTWGAYKAGAWGVYSRDEQKQQNLDPWLAYQENYVDHEPNAYAEEFVWNSQMNRYIPASEQEARSFLGRMADRLDRQLSQLNVKP
jgi:hypothetical protein